MGGVDDRRTGGRRFGVRAFLVVGLAVLSILGPARLAAAGPYLLTDLLYAHYARSVNNNGQVTGYRSLFGYSDAFFYSGGGSTYLRDLLGYNTRGSAINDAGQIVGTMPAVWQGILETRAFLYSNGTSVDLGGLNHAGVSATYTTPYDINNSGQVVGQSHNGWANRAFLYSGGAMTDLGTLGGNQSVAVGINNLGQVVGQADLPYSFYTGSLSHAFLYDGGAMTDLGTFGGSYSTAYDINNAGQIVGAAMTAAGRYHAFLYQGGAMHDIGTLAGGESYATGINASGQIVGYSLMYGSRAFLYSGGKMTDLADLAPGLAGWTNTFAMDINDLGQIVGYGTVDGYDRGFLLTPADPVPEPQSLALFGTGLVGLVGRAFRSRRARIRSRPR